MHVEALGVAVALVGIVVAVSSTRSSVPERGTTRPPTIAAAAAPVDPIRPREAAPIAIDPAPAPMAPRITARPAPMTWPAVAKPSPAPAPAAVPPAPELTPAMIAEQYAEVGRALSRLRQTHGQDATIDLWPRFRYIHINEAIVQPARRHEAARILATLKAEVSARSAE